MNFKTFSKFFDFLPPELLHSLFIGFLKTQLYKTNNSFENLKIKVFGNEFKNPLGLAAGFDKNAEVIKGAINLGFGFLELGTVTPMPQYGNQKPRVFKIPEIEAVIQRLGFNNKGVEEFLDKLKKAQKIKSILGVNIGKNKNSKDLISDYNFLYQKLEAYSDYITINISSPNTENLRSFHNENELNDLLYAIKKEKVSLKTSVPTVLKISPDINDKEISNIIEIIKKYDIEGIIISNTTDKNREKLLDTKKNEEGGLSGKPIKEISTKLIKKFYSGLNKKITIIGVGGIDSGEAAFEKITAGASAVQLYTGMVYKGPGVAREIKKELISILKNEKVKRITDIIGISA